MPTVHLRLRNQPGSLQRVLSLFTRRRIGISCLHAEPSTEDPSMLQVDLGSDDERITSNRAMLERCLDVRSVRTEDVFERRSA